MTQHLAVVQQVIVPGDVGHCWSFLSDPRLLSEWFADTDQIKLNEPVHFTFGDGDFFAATVLEIEEPTFLHLAWKFMGVGVVSDISFFLCPLEGKTEVTVVDRGEYTIEAAAELRAGWKDFLSRLERKITTGDNSRYRWRLGDGDGPGISLEAIVQCDKAMLVRTMQDVFWWRNAFPHSNPGILPTGADESVRVSFQEDAWAGQQTKASVEFEARRDGLGVSVTHTGWVNLPQEIQLETRKRFAALWFNALLELEHRFGFVGEDHLTAFDIPALANTE